MLGYTDSSASFFCGYDCSQIEIHYSLIGSRRHTMSAMWSVLLVLLTTALSDAVIMAPPDDVTGAEEGLGVCLKGGGPVLPCLNAGALEYLEEANQRGGVEVLDGLELVQDDGQSPRSIVPLDHDPNDIRSLWDASAMFLERRSLRWDLGLLYPGLALRVGPTVSGHGILEFLLDHRKQVDDRAMGTGRLLLKRTLLPVLLGIKLNVVTLMPIIFGVLVLIIKKALFFSKAALLISGLLGYNQLQQQQYPQYQQHQYGSGSGLGSYHHQGGYNGHHQAGSSSYAHHIVDPLEDTLLKAQIKYKQDVPFTTRDFSWTERDKKKSMR